MTREEAIQIVKTTKDWGELRLALQELVPELNESEDERIRKWLFDKFNTKNEKFVEELDNYRGFVTREQILAYLKKQKKQKPEIKYVYPKFRIGDVIEPITPNGHFTPVRVVGIWDGSYSCRSDDDKAHLSLPIKCEDEYRLVEQKSAWSEEDSVILDCAVEVVEKAGLPSLAASLKFLRSQIPLYQEK